MIKIEKGHAVAFDFDGVIHKYSKDDKMGIFMISLIKRLLK